MKFYLYLALAAVAGYFVWDKWFRKKDVVEQNAAFQSQMNSINRRITENVLTAIPPISMYGALPYTGKVIVPGQDDSEGDLLGQMMVFGVAPGSAKFSLN